MHNKSLIISNLKMINIIKNIIKQLIHINKNLDLMKTIKFPQIDFILNIIKI